MAELNASASLSSGSVLSHSLTSIPTTTAEMSCRCTFLTSSASAGSKPALLTASLTTTRCSLHRLLCLTCGC